MFNHKIKHKVIDLNNIGELYIYRLRRTNVKTFSKCSYKYFSYLTHYYVNFYSANRPADKEEESPK